MRKIIYGLSLFTWFIGNIAVIYGFGKGVNDLIQEESFGKILVLFAIGLVMLVCCIIVSILVLCIIGAAFGDSDKWNERCDRWLHFTRF